MSALSPFQPCLHAAHARRHGTCTTLFTHAHAPINSASASPCPLPSISTATQHHPAFDRSWHRATGPHAWHQLAVAGAAASAQGELSSLDVTGRVACSSAELRAAAYLRAASFYSYPPGRSEWAERSHRRMKADLEWESVTAKVEGRDETYKQLKVTAFIATVPDDPRCPAAQQVSDDLDPSTKLPSEAPGLLPSLVVATLDLNQGRALPAEELQGKWPQANSPAPDENGDPNTQRAYLSNVCVSKSVRRRGVARQLIQQVEEYALQAGVTHMYVHVVPDNGPAVQLYRQALGYQQEAEESETFARGAGRPRRLLLCKRLRH